MSSKSLVGVMEDSGGSWSGFWSWSWWRRVNNVPNNLCSKIQLWTLNLNVQRTLMSLKSLVWVVEDSGGSWLGFGSWSWWEQVYNVPNNLCSKIQISTLQLKVQRALMSSMSLVGVVKDSGGSWLWFWFLIMMVRDLQYSKQTMFQNSAFNIEFKSARNPHILEVLGWSLGGLWRFQTGVLVPDHDRDGSIMS